MPSAKLRLLFAKVLLGVPFHVPLPLLDVGWVGGM